jgi:hypothetical protein
MMMLKRSLIAASLLLATGPALAADDHAHGRDHDHEHSHAGNDKGPHGGAVQTLAGFEAELVLADGAIQLYLLNPANDMPVATEGMQAALLFTQGNTRKGTLALTPAGDHFKANGTVPAEADALVSLRTKDGKSGQARFELGGHSH